jgi:hypothetical protein
MTRKAVRNLPASFTPAVPKATGVFYEMVRWFSNRQFLMMNPLPLSFRPLRSGRTGAPCLPFNCATPVKLLLGCAGAPA